MQWTFYCFLCYIMAIWNTKCFHVPIWTPFFCSRTSISDLSVLGTNFCLLTAPATVLRFPFNFQSQLYLHVMSTNIYEKRWLKQLKDEVIITIMNTTHMQHFKFNNLLWWVNSIFLFLFKHVLFMTEHDKGLGRAKKLCLALSKTHTHAHIICLHW